jgi:hypothetical protein
MHEQFPSTNMAKDDIKKSKLKIMSQATPTKVHPTNHAESRI